MKFVIIPALALGLSALGAPTFSQTDTDPRLLARSESGQTVDTQARLKLECFQQGKSVLKRQGLQSISIPDSQGAVRSIGSLSSADSNRITLFEMGEGFCFTESEAPE